jgi:hypothetical protein
MPRDGHSQRSLPQYARFLKYTVGWLSLIAGVTLAMWDISFSSGYNWLHWRQWGGVILVAIAFLCLRGMKLPERPRTELERCRERRKGSLVSAIFFLFYALLPAMIAWSLWRASPTGVSAWPVLIPAGIAVVLVGVSALMLWRYRREGRTLRRLEGRCGRCGYDLRGLPEPRCPECGTPFTLP